MAHIERKDFAVNQQLDEIEQKLNVLKMQYEKYFTGIERFEPMKDRDNLKRMVRDMLDVQIKNPAQLFRFQQVKARVQSYELYWARNLAMIERGTHPKQKFRADLKAPKAAAPGEPSIMSLNEGIEPVLSPEQEAVLRRRQEQQEKEERALKLVYDKYMEARAKCGQTADLSFDTVRNALRQQVRQLKAQYQTDTVKFRITVEDGKAKVKAVPVTEEKK